MFINKNNTMANLKLSLLLIFLLSSHIIADDTTASEHKNIDNSENRNSTASDTESSEAEMKDWDQAFDEIKGFRMRSEAEINFLLKVTDLTFLRFAYKKSSAKSRKVAGMLKNINQKLGGLASIMQIDCDTFEPQDYSPCQENPYMADSFPRLKLLIAPDNRYDAISKELQNYYEFPWKDDDITEDKLYTYITTNMPYLVKKLGSESVHTFLNNNMFNKVLLFTNKQAPSVFTKGLTNYFYDRLLFGEIQETEKGLIERFNITSFPTMLVYKVFDHSRLLDEPEIITYDGLNKPEKLIEFLQPHALKEKRYVSEGRKIYDDDVRYIASNVEFRTINETNYEDYFNKYQDRNIMVFFNTHDSMKLMYKTVLVKAQ
jgi:hypothetical protein